MIERFTGELRLLPPLSNNFVRARIFAERHAFVRQVRNFEKQIALMLVSLGHTLFKIDNLVADLFHFTFNIFRRVTLRFPGADFFAQTIAIGLQLLQLGLGFATLGIELEQLVDSRRVIAAASRKSFANKIGFLSNQANVEHGAV